MSVAKLGMLHKSQLGSLAIGFSLLIALGHAANAQEAGQSAVVGDNQTVRGLVRSSQRIEYRSDLLAPISQAAFLEGDRFTKGDTLVTLDCSTFNAEHDAAKAAAEAAAIESSSKQRLYKMKAAGRDEYELARALAHKAEAEWEVQKSKLRSCQFNAPFDGRVVELNAKQHEYPPADRPLITVIDDKSLELEMVVPSQWLVWLKVGAEFRFTIDETASVLPAEINRIGAEVDPVSQTIKVIGRITSAADSILAGMSGTAQFTVPSG